ncbi:FAD:protein FMN transferase [Nocardioides sp.]|uniref:FAD:protein FMN transferase n=1 Tax=Nocardioides sp. TaxID=35761 RepID=UPI003D0A681C
MGLPISLALRGRHADDRQGYDAWQSALAELRHVDEVFSTYRADSYVSRLGRGELALGECPAEVAEVLDLAEEARVASAGAFDVRRPGPEGTTVFDPSGVVKGWAVQRAARAFEDLDDTDVCLSGGGDMVCRLGAPDHEPWQIGIEDPHDPRRLLARIPVRDAAVATSGLAHRGAHIVHGVTGAAPQGIASVTVVADDLTWADIDATAAFAQGTGALNWLRTRPGRAGLVVWKDGTTETFATAQGGSGRAPRTHTQAAAAASPDPTATWGPRARAAR